MVEHPILVIKAKQQDGGEAVAVRNETAHHAVQAASGPHFDHQTLAGNVTKVTPFRDDSFDPAISKALQPCCGGIQPIGLWGRGHSWMLLKRSLKCAAAPSEWGRSQVAPSKG
jgi:hypothetical protein